MKVSAADPALLGGSEKPNEGTVLSRPHQALCAQGAELKTSPNVPGLLVLGSVLKKKNTAVVLTRGFSGWEPAL